MAASRAAAAATGPAPPSAGRRRVAAAAAAAAPVSGPEAVVRGQPCAFTEGTKTKFLYFGNSLKKKTRRIEMRHYVDVEGGGADGRR